jgi:hypothetical protein
MTPRKTQEQDVPPQTPAQVAAAALLVAEEARAMSAENNRLLKELHAGLMEPLPGYDRSFVQRATEVVVKAEAGEIVGERLVFWGKVLTALGVIGSAFYAALHFGQTK